MASESEAADDKGFLQSIFGDDLVPKALSRVRLEVVAAWAAVGFASLVLIPYLGAVGLWDCWETHYGEVAREMIQRNDYVFPWWESAPFFSKPVFTMWMQALGMQIVGTMRTSPDAPLSIYNEWGFRMPFAVFSITSVGLLTYALSRLASIRAALATAFVLVTMPLFFLLSRQAVTDTPIVSALTAGIACAMVALLDKETRHRTAWWYAFYVFMAMGTLAKGLLGCGIPGVILILYAALQRFEWTLKSFNAHIDWLIKRAVSPLSIGTAVGAVCGVVAYGVTRSGPASGFWAVMGFVAAFTYLIGTAAKGTTDMPVLWREMFSMRFGTGFLLFCALALPWYYVMFNTETVDDEGKRFWFRFLIHDHFNRLAGGVHTTTPGGSFTYFIEQGGYAMFPWVILIPGVGVTLSRLRLRSGDTTDEVGIIASLWLAFTFALIGSSATKFHHYLFPWLPPLAILMGLFVDRLWKEGISRYALTLAAGVPLFWLVGKDLAQNPKNFTDLFVYNYDRAYPDYLTKDVVKAWATRPLWIGDALALLFTGLGSTMLGYAYLLKRRAWLLGAAVLALVIFAMGLREQVSSAWGITTSWSIFPLLYGAYMLVSGLAGTFNVGNQKRSELGALFSLISAAMGLALLAMTFSLRMEDPWGAAALSPNTAAIHPWKLNFAYFIILAHAGVACAMSLRPKAERTPQRIIPALGVLFVSLGIALTFHVAGWSFPSKPLTGSQSVGLGLLLGAAFMYWRSRGDPEASNIWSVGAAAVGVAGALALMAGTRYQSSNPEGDPLNAFLRDEMNMREVMGLGFITTGVLGAFMAMAQAKKVLFAFAASAVTVWVLWFNWSHWVDLSHHWSQREQFAEYYNNRKPGEPITSFLMNWRGETFYSRNTVKQIKDNPLLTSYAQQPGRKWALVEHYRLGILKGAVGPDKNITLIKKDLNNKFVLVTIE